MLWWLPGGCECCGGCLEAVSVAVAAWRLCVCVCVCPQLQVLVLGNKNDLPNAVRETELIEHL